MTTLASADSTGYLEHMSSTKRSWLAVALLAVGCQSVTPPAVPSEPVKVASSESSDTADRTNLLYTLLDAPYSVVNFDESTPQECLVEVHVGTQTVYSDSFVATWSGAPGAPKAARPVHLQIALRPVDSGELIKARRMRYAISCGDLVSSHLVRNPFVGLPDLSQVHSVTATEGKPTSLFTFSKPDGEAGAIVQVTVSKATAAQVAASEKLPGVIAHTESPWAKAKF